MKCSIISFNYDSECFRFSLCRTIADPEIIEPGQDEGRTRRRRQEASDSEPEEDQDDDDVERRHALLRKRLLNEDIEIDDLKTNEADDEGDEDDEEDDEDESDDDEYESEDDAGPRLKPVFVRKQDRVSLIQQREEEDRKTKEQELEAKQMAEERHKNALKIIEASVQQEEQQKEDNMEISAESIAAVKTDDESEEVAYLNWKVRELQRNKRDKEERDE
jgi:microfibrillar-associated protein 1